MVGFGRVHGRYSHKGTLIIRLARHDIPISALQRSVRFSMGVARCLGVFDASFAFQELRKGFF